LFQFLLLFHRNIALYVLSIDRHHVEFLHLRKINVEETRAAPLSLSTSDIGNPQLPYPSTTGYYVAALWLLQQSRLNFRIPLIGHELLEQFCESARFKERLFHTI